MRHAWIISVGRELLDGAVADTNAPWLSQALAAIGVRTLRCVVLPDDADDVAQTLRLAARAAELVIVTGGLGPTEDDVTRGALAAAADVPLELHAPSLERIRAYFATRQRPMPDANRVQALIPRHAQPLPNTCGTAPGVRLVLGDATCYALPGVPFEMRAMFAREVEPRLRAAAAGDVVLSRRLRTCGLPEAEVGARVRDLMERGRNPDVGTCAEHGLIDVYIRASGPRDEAASLLTAAERELRGRLGEAVYATGEKTLAGAVGESLQERGLTLATAESCTGGLVGQLITDVPGSSAYYLGGVVAYANAAKCAMLGVAAKLLDKQGAVSSQVAEEMASGVARRMGSECGVAVTGIAGPAGGTATKPVGLVYIAAHTPAGTTARELRLGADSPRGVIRMRAAWSVLDLLRRELHRL